MCSPWETGEVLSGTNAPRPDARRVCSGCLPGSIGQRLPFFGVGTGVATANKGTNGNYWSATQVGSTTKAFNWNFNSGNMNENTNEQGYGFSVRLFREGICCPPAGSTLVF